MAGSIIEQKYQINSRPPTIYPTETQGQVDATPSPRTHAALMHSLETTLSVRAPDQWWWRGGWAQGSRLATIKASSVNLSFSTPYLWTKGNSSVKEEDGVQVQYYGSSAETFVFYTTRPTSVDGAIDQDCAPITVDDFDECPNFPLVPCWPPKVTSPNPKKIQRWNK